MLTQYMLLTLPDLTPVPTAGPLFASEFTDSFAQIDTHNHTTFRGKQVPSAGVTINADFPLNALNAFNLRSCRVVNASSALSLPADVACLYVVAGNLWYNNGSGAQIQLTVGNALNAASIGTIHGDYSTSTASVYYTSASATFFFTSATLTAAKMNHGAVTILGTGVGANGVTLQTPHVLSASYAFKLPSALPASTKMMTITSAGQVGDAYDVDNVTLQVTANLLGVVALSITSAKFANSSVTPAKYSASNYAKGSSSGTVTGPGTGTTVASVTITTNGRNVWVYLQPDGSATPGYITSFFSIFRDGTLIGKFNSERAANSAPSFAVIDVNPAAGSHTYTLLCETSSAGAAISQLVLVAIEDPIV